MAMLTKDKVNVMFLKPKVFCFGYVLILASKDQLKVL